MLIHSLHWVRLKAKGEESDKQGDGITDAVEMNRANSRRWRGTGRPGVLQFTVSQRVGHN